MKRFLIPTHCALIFGFFGLIPLAASAQSTVIQIDSPSSSGAIVLPDSGEIFDSRNSNQRHWESLLAKTYPGEFFGVRRCDQLLRKLRKIGLPVALTQSAMDDSLALDDSIDFQLMNVPLYMMLEQALGERNAALLVKREGVFIVSLDEIGDPRHFSHITYDVSAINTDELSLEVDIKNFAPDDWDDTNGDGSLVIHRTGNRMFVTIHQPYPVHRQIRAHLEGRLKLQGSSGMIASAGNRGVLRESQVIELPRPREFGGGAGGAGGFGGGGQGIGGYGLGGGIF